MKKIRIGNDITIIWEITKNGDAMPLEGRNLTVYATSCDGTNYTLTSNVSGNIIYATFRGKDQQRIGNYNIALSENMGAEGMITIDTIKAFMLVPHSYMEGDDDEEDLITSSTNVGLQSDIAVNGVTQSSVEEAVNKEKERAIGEEERLAEEIKNHNHDERYYNKDEIQMISPSDTQELANLLTPFN